jgi:hypothetical protein
MKAQNQLVAHCHAKPGRTGAMLHAYYLAEGLGVGKIRSGRGRE